MMRRIAAAGRVDLTRSSKLTGYMAHPGCLDATGNSSAGGAGMDENRSYTRSDVYDLVWSKPVDSLEDVFGMTGRAIAKRCDRFNIPVPIRGHWQKVAAG